MQKFGSCLAIMLFKIIMQTWYKWMPPEGGAIGSGNQEKNGTYKNRSYKEVKVWKTNPSDKDVDFP